MKDTAASLLIRTRWLPPRIDKRVLERARLLVLFEQASERKLTVIQGPAGSGKSTAAAQLRRRLIASGCDVAWLNLSADDDAAWAAYLVAALEDAGLATSGEMSSLAERQDRRSAQLLATLLVNAIHDHAKTLCLFLDDLHLLKSTLALECIDRLIEFAPDNFRVVICSRERPALRLVDVGIRGQLLNIGFADLRLTLDEQAGLLALQGVDRLSGVQQRRLHELTDGWAAAVQMSAVSLRQDGDFERSIQGWYGSGVADDQGVVEAYLDDCLRRVMAPEQFEVVLHMSLCRRFCRDLCTALSPGVDGARVLDVLIERNLFLLPVESAEVTQWYRFHQMFSGYLDRHRNRLAPESVTRTHHAASRWFAEQGLYVEAVRHALGSGDPSLCADLLARAARSLLGGAHFASLLQLVDSVPSGIWQGRIDLLLAVAWAQLTCTRLTDFASTMEALARHVDAGLPAVNYETRLLRAMYLGKLDDTDAALEILEPMLADPPRHSNFHLLVLYTLTGTVLLQANRGIRVRDLVREGRAVLNHVQGSRPRPFLDALHGMSLMVQGDLRHAREDLESVLESARSDRALSTDATLLMQSALALCCYGLDDLDAAEDHLESSIDLVEVLATTDSILYAHLAQARLHHAHGLVAAAHATLERLGEIGLRFGVIRLQAWACAEQARIACREGDLPLARDLMRRLDALATPFADKRDCAWSEIPLARATAEADLALAEGDPGRAAQLGREWVTRCKDSAQVLSTTVLRIRTAIALVQCGDIEGARSFARTALTDATENAMNRVFLDEGPAALRLFDLCGDAGNLAAGQRAFVERCRRSSSLAGSMSADMPVLPPDATKLLGPNCLSPRELDVVRLLGRALSTKTIARTLDVSAGTVKWHLKNVFGKLNAVSREDAVNKARQLGLVA